MNFGWIVTYADLLLWGAGQTLLLLVISVGLGFPLAIGIAPTTLTAQAALGFALAAGSATVWACYSLLCRRVPAFSSWAIGGFALAMIETLSAKMRIFRAPEFLGTAFMLAVLAMLVNLLLGA